MRTIGVYLIFLAVAFRSAVVFFDNSQLIAMIVFLAVYGFLLSFETFLIGKKNSRFSQSHNLKLVYLLLQSTLVVGMMSVSKVEDFFSLLFIPLSLDSVSFFGRRKGNLWILAFSLAMTCVLLFSDEGVLFGLAMAGLYGGLCFLFGGFAYQVQKAEMTHNQNQLAYENLQIAHNQLQGYATQLESLAIEQESNRLARDLHDSVTQTVFSMNLTAQSARLLSQKEPQRVSELLLRLEGLASNALKEIQILVTQLRPRTISEEGLPSALRRLADEHQTRGGLQVSLEITGEGLLSEVVSTGLYAIAHEALTNIIKHSGVREATLRLNLDARKSSLEIEDRGSGFDPRTNNHQDGHLGLKGMSERAIEIGWNFSVDSSPSQGTLICMSEKPAGGIE